MNYHADEDIRLKNKQSRVFVIKGNKILIMYRRKNNEEYFVFPGGHMRVGESSDQTAIREVFEKTSIKCKIKSKAFEVIDYADGKEKFEYYFVGEWLDGEPKLNGEELIRCSDLNYFEPRWVDLSEIENLLIYPASTKEWV